MKTRIILILSLLMVVNCQVKAQKQYFQTIDGNIKVIKVNNTHAKCYISVLSSQETNEVSLSFSPKQSLFTIIGDTMVVEESSETNQTSQEIHIRLKEENLTNVQLSPNTESQILIDGEMPFFHYSGGQFSKTEIKNPHNIQLELLDVVLDSNAVLIVSDSMSVNQYMSIVVRDNGKFECKKLTTPKRYCNIKSRPEGVIIDNRTWKSYPHLIRDENNLPTGVESWQMYYNIDLFGGMLTNKSDYLGKNMAYGFNIDMMFQYNFAYQNALLFGWGIGTQIIGFEADGYKQSHGIADDGNFSLQFTCNIWRVPIVYRRYLDDKIKAPSVDLGLILYWKMNTSWHENKSKYISDDLIYKSATEFGDIMRKFQLDIYLGLNLGRKFSLYGTFGLLPAMEKGEFDNMRMINVGIKYKWDLFKTLDKLER